MHARECRRLALVGVRDRYVGTARGTAAREGVRTQSRRAVCRYCAAPKAHEGIGMIPKLDASTQGFGAPSRPAHWRGLLRRAAAAAAAHVRAHAVGQVEVVHLGHGCSALCEGAHDVERVDTEAKLLGRALLPPVHGARVGDQDLLDGTPRLARVRVRVRARVRVRVGSRVRVRVRARSRRSKHTSSQVDGCHAAPAPRP